MQEREREGEREGGVHTKASWKQLTHEKRHFRHNMCPGPPGILSSWKISQNSVSKVPVAKLMPWCRVMHIHFEHNGMHK